MEKACFGAGCFWGIQQRFARLDGVIDTQVGYSGGNTNNPTYKEVCSGTTNHAEVCEVHFDPQKNSFEQLIEVFWKMHDPTTLNRQGPDFGTQYRSAIFTYSDEQEQIAQQAKTEAASRFRNPIVTQIAPINVFWPAEDYHQHYFQKRGMVGGCH